MSEIERITDYVQKPAADEREPVEEVTAAVEDADEVLDYEDDYNNEGITAGKRYNMEDFKTDMNDMADSVKEAFTEVVNREKLEYLFKDSEWRRTVDSGVAKTKEALKKPVDLSGRQDGSFKVPAGILGAAAVAALYPLHRSKLVSAAGAAAVGVWAVNQMGGAAETKEFVKDTARHIHDSLNNKKPAEADEDAVAEMTILLKPEAGN